MNQLAGQCHTSTCGSHAENDKFQINEVADSQFMVSFEEVNSLTSLDKMHAHISSSARNGKLNTCIAEKIKNINPSDYTLNEV